MLTDRSEQWDESSYFWIELGAAAQNDELSLKLYYDDGNTDSFIFPAGAKVYRVRGSDTRPFVCEKVTLMYRKSDVPRVVFLCGTVLNVFDDFEKNVLPSPLHENHAIVTEL